MDKFTFFWSGPFSQWHPSVFVIDGRSYTHAEQYMMEQKALLFGDEATAEMIRLAATPREQKALGREVKPFDKDRWDAAARPIVFKGNWAKFTQNPDLKERLLATAGTTLVEASPKDRVWGIGLAENDRRASDRSKWLGLNWLGQVLTQVRDAMIKSEESPSFRDE